MNAKAVQVKTRDWPDAGEMEGLKLLLAPTNCQELVHLWRNRQRVPDVREMAS